MTDLKRGDKRLCGTYWSERGPIRIELEEYVWDGECWVMAESPIAKEIEKEAAAVIDG